MEPAEKAAPYLQIEKSKTEVLALFAIMEKDEEQFRHLLDKGMDLETDVHLSLKPCTESWEQAKADLSRHPFSFQCKVTKVEGNIVFVCHEDQGDSYTGVVIERSEEPKDTWKVFVSLITWVAGILEPNTQRGLCNKMTLASILRSCGTNGMKVAKQEKEYGGPLLPLKVNARIETISKVPSGVLGDPGTVTKIDKNSRGDVSVVHLSMDSGKEIPVNRWIDYVRVISSPPESGYADGAENAPAASGQRPGD